MLIYKVECAEERETINRPRRDKSKDVKFMCEDIHSITKVVQSILRIYKRVISPHYGKK